MARWGKPSVWTRGRYVIGTYYFEMRRDRFLETHGDQVRDWVVTDLNEFNLGNGARRLLPAFDEVEC